jgi:hypothetical protein
MEPGNWRSELHNDSKFKVQCSRTNRYTELSNPTLNLEP